MHLVVFTEEVLVAQNSRINAPHSHGATSRYCSKTARVKPSVASIYGTRIRRLTTIPPIAKLLPGRPVARTMMPNTNPAIAKNPKKLSTNAAIAIPFGW